MEKYPWCDGIDIDLEKGDGYSTHAASTAMFRNIYNTVKGYDNSKLINICLPGMNSINGSVGGETGAFTATQCLLRYGGHHELWHGVGRLCSRSRLSKGLAGAFTTMRSQS